MTASSWDSKTTAGPENVKIDSSTPAVFTTAPSSEMFPRSTARPPSTEWACSIEWMQPFFGVQVQGVPALGLGERLGGAHAAGGRVEQLDGGFGGLAAADVPVIEPGAQVGAVHGADVVVEHARRGPARPGWRGCRRRGGRPRPGTSPLGATLVRHGVRREIASMSSRVKSSSASCAAASRCRIVLEEPPMAMSMVMAFSNAARSAMARGSTDSSSSK